MITNNVRGTALSNYELIKKTKIDGEFEGFDEEMLFKLIDGSYWIQDQYKYWYYYAYGPIVNILKSGCKFFLQVDGKDTVVPIKKIDDVIESQIDDDFNGWEGESVYKLTNGQKWKQNEHTYESIYAFMPDILIYDTGETYKMKVEGTCVEVVQI